MNKLNTIILYLIPILLVSILTKSITYFLLSGGIMTILLGLSIKFITKLTVYKEKNQKIKNNYLYIIISGILLIISSSQM
ncbi:hypothetical protein [Clostridium psychrophilum]|uniref:hypothetical protein n=1 Tax=Clostridium psychrophilum TaxID=132926 RepID=UPI001C0D8927|nr:hypothetical protein [Clostridium psychrophilum]MBU3182868.1 hypothetical protein [Clostridium psychrophilum]